MRFFVINLDRDKDRLEYMTGELAKRGIEVERIPAFLGLDIPDDLKRFFLDKDGQIDSAMNKGEIGCYASHLFIMQHILAEGINEPVFVFEDDLEFTEAFDQMCQNIDKLPVDWEIVRLSNPTKAAVQTIAGQVGTLTPVKYWRVPNNTGAYLINHAGAQKFLSCRSLRKRPVDEDLRRPWEHRLVTYGLLPAPIISNIFDSSISNIGGDRSLPGRKRFIDAGDSLVQEWSYRRREFGLFGCIKAIISTLLFRKRIRNKWSNG